MLANKNRIASTRDFALIKEKGKSISSKSFLISYLDKKDESETRFGFIVSNKIDSLAVHRNRIKRAFREAARHKISQMKKGYDIVVVAKQASVKVYTSDLMRELEEMLTKLNLMK